MYSYIKTIYLLFRALYINKTKDERLMSTPGRKRVQPILIQDDDDDNNETVLTNNEEPISTSSSSSNINLQNSITTCPPELTSDLSVSSPNIIQQSIRKNLYVPLNFDELSHIRNGQTNKEFATLLYDFNLYTAVVNGHICFSCRKVKFSLFKPSTRCEICLQYVCSKCQHRIKYPQDSVCFVSLNLLRRLSVTNATLIQNVNNDSALSSSFIKSKAKQLDTKQNSKKSFSCCIDCYILFDPASIV